MKILSLIKGELLNIKLKDLIQIDNSVRFNSGIYLIKVIGDNQKTYNQ